MFCSFFFCFTTSHRIPKREMILMTSESVFCISFVVDGDFIWVNVNSCLDFLFGFMRSHAPRVVKLCVISAHC